MQVDYYSDWREKRWTCAKCGWAGTGAEADHEHFSALMELNCGECFSRLAVVLYPDEDDLRRDAEAGNAEALGALSLWEANAPTRETWQREWQASRVRLEALPALADEHLTFTLHAEGRDWMNPEWISVMNHDREIYREPSGFEHWEAIIDIAAALKAQYGERLDWFDPAEAGTGLLGDDLTARSKITTFLVEAGLTPPTGPWSKPKG